MTILTFTALVFTGSFGAGLLGALTGLGGGVVLVPLLTLGFGVDIHYAMGASLVSVLGMSSGATARFMKEGLANLRIGMFLETGATVGAIVGALAASHLPAQVLAVLFGAVLLYSAWTSARRNEDTDATAPSDALAVKLRMEGEYPTKSGLVPYRAYKVVHGWVVMGIAGVLSGLLGIGAGAVKVLAMDHFMRLPYKVSTTTSNFIIGITAGASAGVYFARGYVDPGLTMPVMLGVLAGALIGSRLLVAANSRALRLLFSAVVVLLGVQMIYKGFHWGIG